MLLTSMLADGQTSCSSMFDFSQVYSYVNVDSTCRENLALQKMLQHAEWYGQVPMLKPMLKYALMVPCVIGSYKK